MITNITLTTKERFLLEDAKSHEEICIKKYENYANLSSDPQLKAVFRSNGEKEKEHLQTINTLLSGQVPSMSGSNQSSQGSPQQQNGQNQQVNQQSMANQPFLSSDKDLCTDMLQTEKYVSSTYNTTIFEFQDAQVRDVLNHIQKEEQKHGEAITAYMISKGMYTPK